MEGNFVSNHAIIGECVKFENFISQYLKSLTPKCPGLAFRLFLKFGVAIMVRVLMLNFLNFLVLVGLFIMNMRMEFVQRSNL